VEKYKKTSKQQNERLVNMPLLFSST